jgi:hypothetical protein
MHKINASEGGKKENRRSSTLMRDLGLKYVRRELYGEESAGMGVERRPWKGLLRMRGEEVLGGLLLWGGMLHNNTPGL